MNTEDLGYFLLPAIIFVPIDTGKKEKWRFLQCFIIYFMSEILNVSEHFGCEREIAMISSYDLRLKNCSLWKCRHKIIRSFGMPFVTAEFVLLFQKRTLCFLCAVIVPKICSLLLVPFVCLPLLLAKKNSCINYILNQEYFSFLWVSIRKHISWCKCYSIWKK